MGKKIKRTYLIAAVTFMLIALLLPTITGCTPEGKELALAFLREWAREKKIDPGTVEGGINIAKRAFGGSTGDEEADAAIDAGLAIKNIVDADNLMAEGIEKNDNKKMESAIAMRPNDWTYRVHYSTYCVSRDPVKYQDQASKGYSIVKQENNKNTTLKWYDENIEQLEALRNEKVGSIEIKSPHETYGGFGTAESEYLNTKQLAIYYDSRAQLTGSASDKQAAVDYQSMANQIEQDYSSTFNQKYQDNFLFKPY